MSLVKILSLLTHYTTKITKIMNNVTPGYLECRSYILRNTTGLQFKDKEILTPLYVVKPIYTCI